MSHLCAWRTVALRGSLWRCIRSRSLYRHFVLSLALSLFTIILFQKSELIVEGFLLNFGKFTKRCGATDSNNMRIANCTLTLQKFAESLQQ